jgi:hypothetical protein
MCQNDIARAKMNFCFRPLMYINIVNFNKNLTLKRTANGRTTIGRGGAGRLWHAKA